MADITLGGTVAPGGPFPIARDTDLYGGFRVVSSTAARDAIIAADKTIGMFVFVQADSTLYRLASTGPDVWVAFSGSSVANWTATTRFFAVDYDLGSDTNAGFSDVSMAAAGLVAKKTWEGLLAIIPIFGAGKNVEIAIKRKDTPTVGSTYRNAANTADARLDVSTLLQYTGRFSIRGTATDTLTASSTAFSDDVNDQIFCGARRASGSHSPGYKITRDTTAVLSATNAGPIVVAHSGTLTFTTGERIRITGAMDGDLVDSYLNALAGWVITVVDTTHFSLDNSSATNMADVDAVSGGTITRFKLVKADTLAAAGLPSGVRGMRLRGDSVANTTVATRNLCKDIMAATTDTVVFNPGADFTSVSPTGDIFYLEDPGVAFAGYTFAGRGNIFRVAGIRSGGGQNSISITDCSVLMTFVTGGQGAFSNSPNITTTPTWPNSASVNRIVGGGLTGVGPVVVTDCVASFTNFKVTANGPTINDCDNIQFITSVLVDDNGANPFFFNRSGELSVNSTTKTFDRCLARGRILVNNSNGYLDTVHFEGNGLANGFFQTVGNSMRWVLNKIYDARVMVTGIPGVVLGNLQGVPAIDTLVTVLTPTLYAKGSQSLSTSWLSQINPTTGTNFGIWGAAPDDIWFATGITGSLLHWNGSAYSFVSTPGTAVTRLWGFSSTDVWGVSATGSTTIHWDGATWSTVSNTGDSWGGIWGAAPDDIWTVGQNGIVNHWNGTAWSTVADLSATAASFNGVYGSGPNDVWAASELDDNEDNYAHWDGVSWTMGSSGNVDTGKSFFAFSPTNVWFGQFQNISNWNGSTWTNYSSGGHSDSIWGAAPNDIWSCGVNSFNQLRHWNGTAWSPVNKQLTNTRANRLFGFSATDVWVTENSGGIEHYNPVGNDFSEVALNVDYCFRARDLFFTDIGDSYGNRVFLSYLGLGGKNNFVRPPLPLSALADNQDIARYKVVRVTSLESPSLYNLIGSSVKHIQLAQADSVANTSGELLVTRISTFGGTTGAMKTPTLVYASGLLWVVSDDLPVPGDIMYLSPTTGGNITKTSPAVSGTNQKRRVGLAIDAVAFEGVNMVLVNWAPEMLPVSADGNP